jgi:hypothetical protein
VFLVRVDERCDDLGVCVFQCAKNVCVRRAAKRWEYSFTSEGASLRSIAYTAHRPRRPAPSSCSSCRHSSAQGPTVSRHSRVQELYARDTALGSDRESRTKTITYSREVQYAYVAKDISLGVRQICHTVYLILAGHQQLASYGYMKGGYRETFAVGHGRSLSLVSP